MAKPAQLLAFDAVFFDLDGTLIDTELLAKAAGVQALARAGFADGHLVLDQVIGKDHGTSAQIIRAMVPGLDMQAFDRDWRELFDAKVAADLPLKPGAVALLDRIAHLPRALVTSSRRDAAEYKLSLAGLSHHFQLVISWDDVAHPKPAPDPYLLAASRFGVDPARCLAFEDSETGAESAHRAGCRVVQVPDILPSDGRWAHHLAETLLAGAAAAGLI